VKKFGLFLGVSIAIHMTCWLLIEGLSEDRDFFHQQINPDRQTFVPIRIRVNQPSQVKALEISQDLSSNNRVVANKSPENQSKIQPKSEVNAAKINKLRSKKMKKYSDLFSGLSFQFDQTNSGARFENNASKPKLAENQYRSLQTGSKMDLGTLDGRIKLPLILRKREKAGAAVMKIIRITDRPEQWKISWMQGDPYFRAALYESLTDSDNFELLKNILRTLDYSEFFIHLEYRKEHLMYAKVAKTEFHLNGNRLRFRRVDFFQKFRSYQGSNGGAGGLAEGLKSGEPALFWGTQPADGTDDLLVETEQLSAVVGAKMMLVDEHAELAKIRDRLALKGLRSSPAFLSKIRNRLLP